MSRRTEGAVAGFMHGGLDVMKLIQATLEESGETQKSLMERAGLAARYLHRFKDAKCGPNLATLRRLHAAGVRVESLFNGAGPSASISHRYSELAAELRAERERLPVGRLAAGAHLTRMAECCDLLRRGDESTPPWLGFEDSDESLLVTNDETSQSQLRDRILSWTGAVIAIRSEVSGELTRAQALVLYSHAKELSSVRRREGDTVDAISRDGLVTFDYFFDVVRDLWLIPMALEMDAGRRPTMEFFVANRDDVWSTGLAVCSWLLAGSH